MDKSIPFKAPSHTSRLVIFLFLSVFLMLLDHRGTHLQQIRSGLSVLVYPIQVIASVPLKMGGWVINVFSGNKKMREEYTLLKRERPLLLGKLQKFDALEVENRRLRALLKSAERIADRAVIAEILEVHPEPFTRKIVISKGNADNVYMDQPVIDSYGIMGQITETGPLTSRVTLITDASYAILIQVNRNGLRTISMGTGAQNSVSLPFLPANADIRKGDLLITSGMGGVFPPGYPVAIVDKIINDQNEPFLQITATPKAKLNHNKEVLLIWPGNLNKKSIGLD